MTHEERGLYILALCLQWGCGSLSSDDFGRLGSAMAQPSIVRVMQKFDHGEDGRFRNARMERERKKQQSYRDERAKSGKKGAIARWEHGSANGSAIKEPLAKGMANDGSPSPSPSPIKKSSASRAHLEPNGDHATLIDLWTKAYPEHHGGESYAFQGGKDGAAVKSLLSTSQKSPDDLMRIAVAAWKNPGGFNCKMAASICGFNSKFNDIRNELNALKNGTTANQPTSRNVGHNAGLDYSKRPVKPPSSIPSDIAGNGHGHV